jgi:hypothetical protein
MGVVVVVSVAHCAGVCSAVGAHGWNINESRFFGMVFTGCVLVRVRRRRVPFWGCGVVGKVLGCGVWGLCLAHCWVLRQQDLFAAMHWGTSGVSFVPATGTWSARWCGVGVVDGVVV